MPAKANTKKPEVTLREAYMRHITMEGKPPASVYRFCADTGITEEEFYGFFSGFPAIEKDFWTGTTRHVFSLLEESPEWKSYSVREKILAFYFTWLQEARRHRSFVCLRAAGWLKPLNRDSGKKALESMLNEWFSERVREGMETGEIQHRPLIASGYDRLLTLQFFFFLDFWIRDESTDFEDTDALTEKSMQVVFDLLQQNTLDKTADLAKFLWSRMAG